MLENGKSPKIEFSNWKAIMRLPFVVYADSEAILMPTTTTDFSSKSYTNLNKHEVCAMAYVQRADALLLSN